MRRILRFSCRQDKPVRGFTLVELIVSMGILSIFFAGAFAAYKMGGDMFLSGSWRLRKQKDSERFLAILRNKIEMTGPVAVVTRDSALQWSFPVFSRPSGTVFGSGARQRILLFMVPKTDLSAIDPARRGLLMPHILSIEPDLRPEKQGTGILKLEGFSVVALPPGILGDFLVELNGAMMGRGDFSATPETYGLGGPNGFSVMLDEVASVTLELAAASGTIDANSVNVTGQTLQLTIQMVNPRDARSGLSQTVSLKLDDGAPVRTRGAL